MRTLNLSGLTILIFLCFRVNAVECLPAEQVYETQPNFGLVQSPGVGLRRDLTQKQGESSYKAKQLFDNSERLGRIYVRLDQFKDGTNISQEFLSQLDNELRQVKRDGLKVELRFTYNYPCGDPESLIRPGVFHTTHVVCEQDKNKSYPWNDPKLGDASLETIRRHITELAPILKRNADVITGVGGFVGRWGEQHHSTNDLAAGDAEHTTSSQFSRQAEVVKAIATAFPGKVIMRYPWQREKAFDSRILTKNLESRVALENDCFLADDHDAGTFPGNLSAVNGMKAYFAKVGHDVMAGGETCHLNSLRTDCSNAISEMKTYQFSYLTDGFPAAVFDRWKNSPSPDRHGSCYDYIKSHLGYRFALKNIELPSQVKPKQKIHLKFSVQNDGFARAADSRPVFVTLRCDSGFISKPIRLTNIDARNWPPGSVTSVDSLIEIPENLPSDDCKVALSLPDANIRQDPRYAIQLANQGLWDAKSGLNIIPLKIHVTKTPQPLCRENASTSHAATR